MCRRSTIWLLILTVACLPSIAGASVILEYHGNDFTDADLAGATLPADLYTTSDSVSGWLMLSNVLAPNLTNEQVLPTLFSFTDGVNTLDQSNVWVSGFWFTTDASGSITDWGVGLKAYFLDGASWRDQLIGTASGVNPVTSATYDTATDYLCGPGSTSSTCVLSGDPYYSQGGYVGDAPGTWNYSKVPTPPTLLLLVPGLIGLILGRRRTR